MKDEDRTEKFLQNEEAKQTGNPNARCGPDCRSENTYIWTEHQITNFIDVKFLEFEIYIRVV